MNYKYKLLIGLGNPGEDYESTYHNVGLLFLDYFFNGAKFKVYKNFKYAKIGNVIIVKPLTFMNESGTAVSLAMKYFKASTKELLTIHDDSDIELGKYKVSAGRGGAGHKGVESVIKALGTKDFARLRIGIRPKARVRLHAEAGRTKAGDFVLRKISRGGAALLEKTFDKIYKESKLILKGNGESY